MDLLRSVVPSPRFSRALLCADADSTQCKAGTQAIFTPSPPFLSLISVTQLLYEPEANQLPHRSLCRVTSTMQHCSRGRENKQECWNQTGRWKQLQMVSLKHNYSIFFVWNPYRKKLKMPRWNSHLCGTRWDVRQRVLVLLCKIRQNLPTRSSLQYVAYRHTKCKIWYIFWRWTTQS